MVTAPSHFDPDDLRIAVEAACAAARPETIHGASRQPALQFAKAAAGDATTRPGVAAMESRLWLRVQASQKQDFAARDYEGWWVDLIAGNTDGGMVAIHDTLAVGLRGTEGSSLRDLWDVAGTCGRRVGGRPGCTLAGRAPAGFLRHGRTWSQASLPAIREAAEGRRLVWGFHSLGGAGLVAVAQMVALGGKDVGRVYLFGTPPYADRELALGLERLLVGRVIYVRHPLDVVPTLTPRRWLVAGRPRWLHPRFPVLTIPGDRPPVWGEDAYTEERRVALAAKSRIWRLGQMVAGWRYHPVIRVYRELVRGAMR